MKHTRDDGRGMREVWLDGFLIECVIECDDELGTVVVHKQPLAVADGELVKDTLVGDTLVVRRIDYSFWQM